VAFKGMGVSFSAWPDLFRLRRTLSGKIGSLYGFWNFIPKIEIGLDLGRDAIYLERRLG